MRYGLRATHLASVLGAAAIIMSLVVVSRPARVHAAAPTTTLTACTESELDAAVASGGTIVVACNSPIKLSNQITIPASSTVVLDGTGYTASISGNYITRIFDVEGGSLTLTNLTVTAGSVNGTDSTPVRGGAMFIGSGNVTLNGVTVSLSGTGGTNGADGANGTDGQTGTPGAPGTDGEWADGGAIYNTSGTLTVNNSTFSQNFVIAGNGGQGGSGGNATNGGTGGSGADAGNGGSALGGAIYNDASGTLNITGSTFTSNTATAGYGGRGGAAGNGGAGTGGVWGANGGDGPPPINNAGPGQPGTSGADGTSGSTGGPSGFASGNAGNDGRGQGGAIYNAGTMKVLSSTFTQNRITSATGLNGGFAGYAGNGGAGGPGGAGGIGSNAAGGDYSGGAGGWGGNGGSGGNGASGTAKGGRGGNGSEADGGAIYTLTSVVLTGDTFTNNSANGGPGGAGGHGAQGGPAGMAGGGGSGGNGGDGNGTGLGGVGGNGGSGGNAGTPGNGTDGGQGGNGGSAYGGAFYANAGATLSCTTFNGNTVSPGSHGPGGYGGGSGGTGLLGGGGGTGGTAGANGDTTVPPVADGQNGGNGLPSGPGVAGSNGQDGSDGAAAGADVYGAGVSSSGCVSVTVTPQALTLYAKVGTTGTSQTATLSNTGGSSVTITGATLSGANAGAFTKQSDTCTGNSVAAGATCTVTVALQPASIGTFTATLNFADSAPGNPQTVALTGYGVAPSISLPQKKVAIGATYTLSGIGFAPMETVQVTWDTASGTALGSAQADAHGAITLQVTIPQAKIAPHTIVAVGQASMVGATVSVYVVPAKAAP